MEAHVPEQRAKLQEIEDKIERGIKTDSTGKAWHLDEKDEPVDLEPGDWFWIQLARKFQAAIPRECIYPLPSEAREIMEHGMGESRILHPENQAYVMDLVSAVFEGDCMGRQDKFEKPKGGKRPGKAGKTNRPTIK